MWVYICTLLRFVYPLTLRGLVMQRTKTKQELFVEKELNMAIAIKQWKEKMEAKAEIKRLTQQLRKENHHG